MEKVKKLLSEIGASPDMVNAVIASLEDYNKNVKARYDEELKKRLVEARAICVEQFDKTKAELARKVEIFLESKLAAIEKIAQKQVAIGEGKALKTLREAKALFDGVIFEGNNPTNTQAMQEELQALRLQNRQVVEDRNKAVVQAKRANEVAMKLLERQRVAESRVAPKTQPTAPAKKPVVENKQRNLADLRKAGTTPVTTRQPVVENVATQNPTADSEVAKIASQLDDVPVI